MKKKLLFLALIGLVFCASISAANSKVAKPNKGKVKSRSFAAALEGMRVTGKTAGKKSRTAKPTGGTKTVQLPPPPLPLGHMSDSDDERVDTPIVSTHRAQAAAEARETKGACSNANKTVKVQFGTFPETFDVTPMASPQVSEDENGNQSDSGNDDGQEELAAAALTDLAEKFAVQGAEVAAELEKLKEDKAPVVDAADRAPTPPAPNKDGNQTPPTDDSAGAAPNDNAGGWFSVITTAAKGFLTQEEAAEEVVTVVPVETVKELTPKEAADKETYRLLADIKELEGLLVDTPNTPDQIGTRNELEAKIKAKEAELIQITDTYTVRPEKNLTRSAGLLAYNGVFRARQTQAALRKREQVALKKAIDAETAKIIATPLPVLDQDNNEIKFHTTKQDGTALERIGNTPDASAKTDAPKVTYSGPIIKPYSVHMEKQTVTKNGKTVEMEVPVYKPQTKDDSKLLSERGNTNAEETFRTVMKELEIRAAKAKINSQIPSAAALQHALKTKQSFVGDKVVRQPLKKRVLSQNCAAVLADVSTENADEIKDNKKLRVGLKNTVLAAALGQHQLDLALHTSEGYGRVEELDKITISDHPGATERRAALKAERDRTRSIKQGLEADATKAQEIATKAKTALDGTTTELDTLLKQLEDLQQKETALRKKQDEQSRALAYAKLDSKITTDRSDTYNTNRKALLDAHEAAGGNSWF